MSLLCLFLTILNFVFDLFRLWLWPQWFASQFATKVKTTFRPPTVWEATTERTHQICTIHLCRWKKYLNSLNWKDIPSIDLSSFDRSFYSWEFWIQTHDRQQISIHKKVKFDFDKLSNWQDMIDSGRQKCCQICSGYCKSIDS